MGKLNIIKNNSLEDEQNFCSSNDKTVITDAYDITGVDINESLIDAFYEKYTFSTNPSAHLKELFCAYQDLLKSFRVEECRYIIKNVSEKYIAEYGEKNRRCPHKYEDFSMENFCKRQDDALIKRQIEYMIKDGLRYVKEGKISYAKYLILQLACIYTK